VIGTVAEMVALSARVAGVGVDGQVREKVRVYAGRLVACLEANGAVLVCDNPLLLCLKHDGN